MGAGSRSIREEGAAWPAAPRLLPLASVSSFESFAEYGGMTLNSSLSSSSCSSSSPSSICESRGPAILSINGCGRAWRKVQGATALKAGIKHTEIEKNTCCSSCSQKPCYHVNKNSSSQDLFSSSVLLILSIVVLENNRVLFVRVHLHPNTCVYSTSMHQYIRKS